MNYNLKIESIGDYLLFTATGTRSIDSVVSITKDVLAACAKEKVKKALVDVRAMVGHLTTMEAYDLSDHQFPVMRDRSVLVSVVVVDRKENEARYRFLETVAVNRGFSIRYCNNLQEGAELLK
jgi:NMD protein affecting ribosome stability and mRNA decay